MSDTVHAFEDAPLPPSALEEIDLTAAVPGQSIVSRQTIVPKADLPTDMTPLSTTITSDLLHLLNVPQDYHAALLACRTLNDLVLATVPEDIRSLIFDTVSTPDVGRVLEQPEYLAPKGDDLLRFKEGKLVEFLLKLSPDQEKVVVWCVKASRPTLVKGGPGSCKSTVALYHVREVLRVLREAGQPKPRILFTTYTNALVTFSCQLLQNGRCQPVHLQQRLSLESSP